MVLNLDRVSASLFETADRAHDVQGVAVAGVGVDDQVSSNAIADQGQRVGDLAHAHKADVRPPEPGVGDRGA